MIESQELRLGAAVLELKRTKRKLIAELETRADAFAAKALAMQPATGNEVKDWYKAKAKELREKAAEVRKGVR